jgi:hypothetical protein
MRIISRQLGEKPQLELGDKPFLTIGCLSFEQRCTGVPLRFWSRYGDRTGLNLLALRDPSDGIPDYSKEREKKVEENRKRLEAAGVRWASVGGELMASEDELLSQLNGMLARAPDTVVLDITALPKRYFCFYLRRLMLSPHVGNLIVTYTGAGTEGYTHEHLAEDVMSAATVPGFAGRFSGKEDYLVIAIGFEALGLRPLILSLYRERNVNLRILLPFPAPIETVRRQWNTLRAIMEDDPANLVMTNVAIAAAWDAELVYHHLVRWSDQGEVLTFAPYGPKPHTLAMALFAMKNDSSLWYTQPKVYHPDYSLGTGETRWYLLKWEGVRCFDR